MAFRNIVTGMPISVVAGITGGLLLVVIIGVWIWFKNKWRFDVDLFFEKANGAVIKQKTWGRSYLENGISMLGIFSLPHKDRPFPTLDCLIPSGNRPYLPVWVDVSGNLHQIRFSKFLPVFLEKGESIEQQTMSVKLSDGTTKIVGVEEVIFEPDNKSDRAWAWAKLRQMNDKHKSIKWWQDRAMIIILVIAITAIMAIMFAGYYFSEMHSNYVSALGSQIAPATTALQKIVAVIGGGGGA